MTCRVGAALWLCCFQFFVAEQIARLGWTGHYSMARNYISDLGTTQSSLHLVMNCSFILQGLLIFLGAVLMGKCFPAKPVYRVALALFAIAGIGVLLVGLRPEGSAYRLHLAGAAANFLGGNLAMIVLGRALIRRSGCRPLERRQASLFKSWITFAAGSIGLLATVAIAFRVVPSGAALGWDAGTVERLAAYPLPLWLTWTGYLFLRA